MSLLPPLCLLDASAALTLSQNRIVAETAPMNRVLVLILYIRMQ